MLAQVSIIIILISERIKGEYMKNKAAIELAKLRAKSLTKERREEIARNAGKIRWDKKKRIENLKNKIKNICNKMNKEEVLKLLKSLINEYK